MSATRRGVVAALLVAAASAQGWALTATVDGDPAEWLAAAVPLTDDTGYIWRNAAGSGQFVWKDSVGEERTDFATPDPRADITELRITANPTTLFLMVKLSDVDIESGDGVVQVQVAIDIDRVMYSGLEMFGASAATRACSDAMWEFMVVTRFGSANSEPDVYDTSWSLVTAAAAASAISAANDCVEIAVPWAALGGAPIAPVRFTVATFRSDTSDVTWAIGGSSVSNALDVVTSHGHNPALVNTFAEVDDGVIDYFFDVWFHLNATWDPSSPLLINEYVPDPLGSEPDEEWIEIYNRSNTNDFALDGYKIGDEETVGGAEAMCEFPAGTTMLVSAVAVAANRADAFIVAYPSASLPDFEFVSTLSPVPDMVAYAPWASGSIPDLANAGDELLLLDPCDTIIDAVAYGTGAIPGVVAHAAAAEDESLDRVIPYVDTNDCAQDMDVDAGGGTPGTVVFPGSVTCTIEPWDATYLGAQWQMTGGPDTSLHNAYDTIMDVPVGDYTLTFTDVAGWTKPADILVTVTDNGAASETGTYVAQVGTVSCTIAPQGAIDLGAQWELTPGSYTARHDSGDTITDVPAGEYFLVFIDIAGWTKPADIPVTVTDGGAVNETGTYVYGTAVGTVTCTIEPWEATYLGAQWQMTGGPDTSLHSAYDTIMDVPVGDYTLTFTDVAGWTKPADILVTVADGGTVNETGTYIRQFGSYIINIEPQAAIDAGAQVLLVNGGEPVTIPHGVVFADVPVGDYFIAFKYAPGWVAPGDMYVVVTEGATTTYTGVYTEATDGGGDGDGTKHCGAAPGGGPDYTAMLLAIAAVARLISRLRSRSPLAGHSTNPGG